MYVSRGKIPIIALRYIRFCGHNSPFKQPPWSLKHYATVYDEIFDTLVNVRRMMRNSGRGGRVREGRRMNETAWPKRVDEPVDWIPMHGTDVDRARWYHSGQRYPSRLYLVRRGGGGGRRNGRAWMTRNGAAPMYGTSSRLRHNWNSMTPSTGKGSVVGRKA